MVGVILRKRRHCDGGNVLQVSTHSNDCCHKINYTNINILLNSIKSLSMFPS